MELFNLRVLRIVRETKDTISVIFAPTPKKNFHYQAGQFVTFIFSRRGRELRRSYSFSSTPGVDKLHCITLKRIPNGEISRFFTDKLQIGDRLVAAKPAGKFTLKTQKKGSRQIYLIAAGSGIVPVFSLLKKVLHFEVKTEVVLIYQNHDEQTIIFNESLRKIKKRFPARFTLIILLSKPQHRPNLSRKLNNWVLESLLIDSLDSARSQLFFVCGPPTFMRMVVFTLNSLGFRENQVKKEHFTVEHLPPPPVFRDTTPRNITLHYQRDTFRFRAIYPQSILDAGLGMGINLPFSCRAGRCSSCVAKCVSGTVSMSVNEVLTERDLSNGLVLTCVGYPETDVELAM